MALILEVLDARTGEVRTRRHLDGDPVALGRGYDNDIVLDDPYADAYHARITPREDGAFQAEDLGSVNGLRALDGTHHAVMALHGGAELLVGRTRLRVVDSAAPLPPALPDGRLGQRLPRWLTTKWGQLGVTGAAVTTFALFGWLGSFDGSGVGGAVTMALGLLFLCAFWAGGWAVAGRVVVHRFRFLAHLALASGLLLIAPLYTEAASWLGFIFPGAGVGSFLSGVIWFALFTWLIASHLALASSLTPRRRWVSALVTCVILAGLGTLETLTEEDTFSDVPEFQSALKPAPASWLPRETAGEFRAVAEDLQREVDSLAAK